MNSPNKILIIRFSAIGDIVLTTVVIRLLKKRYPKASIHYLTKKNMCELLQFNPHIDKVIGYDANSTSLIELVKEVRNEKYDWIVDVHKNIRSRVIRFFGGASTKVTYSKRYFERFLYLKFKKGIKNPIHTIDKYLSYLHKKGIVNDNLGTAVFYNSDTMKKSVSSYFIKDTSKTLISICPGASYRTKQWSEEHFFSLIKELSKQNFQVVLIGGKQDEKLCERIKVNNKVINLAGKLSLLQSAYVLKESVLAITNDSGMMHLAESQQTPVIAVFGSTTPALGFYPILPNSIVVENNEINCRPCHSKGKTVCPYEHFNCMKKISSKMVMNKINEYITSFDYAP